MLDAPGPAQRPTQRAAGPRPRPRAGMRRPDGRPGGRIRLLAGLLALGLLTATAPLAVYPVARWVGTHV